MSDFEDFSKAELIARLRSLQTVIDREQAVGEAQRLLHELKVHQIELEMQNRELRETQQALEDSRNRYAELYDLAPVGYLTLDLNGRIEQINLTGAALLGRPREQLQGHPFGVFLAPGQNGVLFRHLRETLAHSGEKQTVELRLKNRTQREVRLESIADDSKRCRTAMIDLSEIRRAERNLLDRQIRLQAILDTAADGIITIDAKGAVLSFNHAAERMFGCSAAEVIGRNVSMLMPSPYREEHDGYIRRYLKTGEARIIGIGREVEGRRKDGSVFPMDLAVTEIRDHMSGFTGIVRDISARKAAEAALRDSEERFRQIAEHVHEVFWMYDLDQDQVTYVSPAYESVCGYSVESVRQNPAAWVEVVHPEDRPRIETAYRQMASRHAFDEEYRIVRPDGAVRIIHDRGFPVHDAAGRVYRMAGIAEDVTEARQAAERISELQNELAYLGRFGMASEMAAGLAHELNQPLTAVVTYSQLCKKMLEERSVPVQRIAELMGKITEQGLRGGEIIAQLRRLVGKGKGAQEKTDLNRLVREVSVLAGIEIRRHQVKLRFELAEGLPPIQANVVQIQQVILNLVWNAIEAMKVIEPHKRMLTLRTALSEEDAAQVEITVTDAGPGLSAEAAEKLFTPFFTTKSEGMGLGLSLCRSIVRAHQGRIWATANPEHGVTFHVTLPVVREDGRLG